MTTGGTDGMTRAGRFDAGCGTYKFVVGAPKPAVPLCGNGERQVDNAIKFKASDAQDAIKQYCSSKTAIVSDPQQPYPFVDKGLYDDRYTLPLREYVYGSTTLILQADFTSIVGLDSSECKESDNKDFHIKDYTERCEKLFSTILSSCEYPALQSRARCCEEAALTPFAGDRDTEDEKSSSWLWEFEGDNGCVLWQITAVPTERRSSVS
jgi:hypothetical protein